MRVLIAEDDRQLRTAIVRGLREASYDVDQASTGPQADSMAASNSYDVIILDLLLPEGDGRDVCRAIRARGDQVPILMLTALDGVEQRIEGLDAGADDYLTKPFAFAELLARIRALLRRGAVQGPGRLKLADLELDPAAHRVWRGESEIVLTSKEYALLEYLLRNADRVLTRTAIIEHVWDIRYDSMTNIVDVHIRALRAKIDRPFSVSLIRTIRGVGYALETPREKP